MATFIPLVFPAMWLIDNTGLKNVALIGSGLNAAGSLIKCFGISQLGLLNILWFLSEVSNPNSQLQPL